jgi:hypothetical protein
MAKPSSLVRAGVWFYSVAAACVLLTGCVDFGHTGAYRISPAVSQAFTSSTKRVEAKNHEELRRIVRQTLLASGFEEQTGRRTVWLKDGARALLDETADGALLLTLNAMGSARQVRTAKEIELQLVEALRSHSELTVTATISPKPTTN